MTTAIPKRRPITQHELMEKARAGELSGVHVRYENQAAKSSKTQNFMALDLSSTCTGWAIGEKGKKPVATGSIRPPKGFYTDAERFLIFWKEISAKFQFHKCDFFLAEELNHFTNARTARLLAGLAGSISVLAKKELDCEVLFLNTAKCRSVIAVNLSWDVDGVTGKKTRPDVKKRVAERLKWFGIQGLPEDEADACVILLASGVLVESVASHRAEV